MKRCRTQLCKQRTCHEPQPTMDLVKQNKKGWVELCKPRKFPNGLDKLNKNKQKTL